MKAGKVLLLAFLSMLSLCVVDTQPVKPQSSGTIYIRSDGTVEGTDKIQQDGNVYIFTGEIGTDEWSYGIIVERDNIVVDGASYLLKGHGELGLLQTKPMITGISLDGRNNVTIKNLQIWGFNFGFWGNCCTNIKILGNNIAKIGTNIWFRRCSHSIISDNNMINNGTDGILLESCSNNTFSGNYITDNYYGIHFWQSPNNTISRNKITKSYASGILIEDSSNHNIVSGNNLTANTHGIGIADSFNNTVSGNNITNNIKNGIWLGRQASNNTVTENNITNNDAAIYVREAVKNKFYNNNFINNTQQVYDFGVDFPDVVSPSVNIWDNGQTGNYWSDYEDRYPNATEMDDSGIRDTPYVIDANNQDRYPLMNPAIIPEFPDTMPHTSESFPTTLIVAAIVLLVVVGVGLLVYFRKVRKTTGTAKTISEGVK